MELFRSGFREKAAIQSIITSFYPLILFEKWRRSANAPTGINPGRVGSPLPAARSNAVHGAHGVTRPNNVPNYNETMRNGVRFAAQQCE
jgi:hypothetical protein